MLKPKKIANLNLMLGPIANYAKVISQNQVIKELDLVKRHLEK